MMKPYDPNRDRPNHQPTHGRPPRKQIPHLLFAFIAGVVGCGGSFLTQISSGSLDVDAMLKTGIFAWFLGLAISIMRQRFIRDD